MSCQVLALPVSALPPSHLLQDEGSGPASFLTLKCVRILAKWLPFPRDVSLSDRRTSRGTIGKAVFRQESSFPCRQLLISWADSFTFKNSSELHSSQGDRAEAKAKVKIMRPPLSKGQRQEAELDEKCPA